MEGGKVWGKLTGAIHKAGALKAAPGEGGRVGKKRWG